MGLAGGMELDTTVIPFIIRGVNLLGIDSVMQPFERRVVAWDRLATELTTERLVEMTRSVTLSEVTMLGPTILDGKVQGRIVVDVNA